MHPTLKSKPVPVFLQTLNSLLTGRTDKCLSPGFKEAEMPSMTADVGTLQSNLCVFAHHHFSFIFTLLFFFPQLMRTRSKVPLMKRSHARYKHIQMHLLFSQCQTFINHEASIQKKWLLHQETRLKVFGYLLDYRWNKVHLKFKTTFKTTFSTTTGNHL